MIQPLGLIRVPLAGVPIRVTSVLPNPLDRYACHGVMFQALPTNAGRIYIGMSGMNKATFAQMLAFLAIPTANVIPSYSAALTLSPAAVHLHEMFVDVDQNNDGVIVSVLIT